MEVIWNEKSKIEKIANLYGQYERILQNLNYDETLLDNHHYNMLIDRKNCLIAISKSHEEFSQKFKKHWE